MRLHLHFVWCRRLVPALTLGTIFGYLDFARNDRLFYIQRVCRGIERGNPIPSRKRRRAINNQKLMYKTGMTMTGKETHPGRAGHEVYGEKNENRCSGAFTFFT